MHNHSSGLRAMPRGSTLIVAALAFLLGTILQAQTAKPAASCASLAKLALPDTTITMAEEVGAGQLVLPAERRGPAPAPANGAAAPAPPAPNAARPGAPEGALPGVRPQSPDDTKSLPAFCRVAATIKPTSDSNIRIEVWMPLAGWNGKFMGIGGGGFAGSMTYTSHFDGQSGLADALKRGYATGTTDSGHDSSKPGESDGQFALGHPEKVIDYGYRAVHLMTVESKEFVKAFYGAAPRHSYFFGASRGGYEAITEAYRFPTDYDGIGAAWPPNPFVLFNAQQLWANWWIAHNPSMFIPKEKYAMIHTAVMDACDALDGDKDGMIENPMACHFDPQTLLCKGGDAPDCLTAPQADLLKKTYQGPVNPRTGESIFPGPAMGDELGEMYQFATGTPRAVAGDMYKYIVFKDANWDWKTLDWDKDIQKALDETRPMLTTQPNFSEFSDHGGKLFIFMGWVNYHNPAQVIGFYNQAVKNMGPEKSAKSLRFMAIPGETFKDTMFDRIKAVEDWVEQGKAPDQITGSYYGADGKLARTHPFCAYPKVAQYKGTGDINRAENFTCALSAPAASK